MAEPQVTQEVGQQHDYTTLVLTGTGCEQPRFHFHFLMVPSRHTERSFLLSPSTQTHTQTLIRNKSVHHEMLSFHCPLITHIEKLI